MSQNLILLLQSLLITLTMINMSIAVLAPRSPAIHIVFGAVVAGFQFFVQRIGNQSIPPQMQQNQDMQKNLNQQGGPK